MGDVLKLLKLKRGTVILLVLVPLLLMFLLVFNVFAVELSMPDMNLNTQETEFSIPVQIEDANDVGGFQFEINYDSNVLELEKIENGELINGWLTDSSLGDPLKVIGASISSPITTQSGTLVELYFKIIDTSGRSTNLDFSMVKITDKDGNELNCSSQGAIVTIPQTQNTKPTASISVSASSVYVGTTVTLDGSASSDADNDTLSYSWSFKSKPNGSNATIENADQAQASFTPDVAGNYEVQLVVNDSKEDSDAAVVVVQAQEKHVNSKPIAKIELSESLGYVGDTITLDGSKSSDLDNDTLSYTWSFKSKPANSNATIENSNQAQASFTPDVTGNYEVQLIVNDSKEDSEPAIVTVTIEKQNTKPTASISVSASSVYVGTTVTLDGSASSDADNDTLSYSWSFKSKPNGSNATIENADQAQASFTPDVAGNYEVQLVVNDSKEDSDAAVVVIKVKTQLGYTPIPKTPSSNALKPKSSVTIYLPRPKDNATASLPKPKQNTNAEYLPKPKDNVTISSPIYKFSSIIDYLRQLYYHK